MKLQWCFCSLCFFCIASFVWGQDFNPLPLNQRPTQTPSGVTIEGLTLDAIDDAFGEAINLIKQVKDRVTSFVGSTAGVVGGQSAIAGVESVREGLQGVVGGGSRRGSGGGLQGMFGGGSTRGSGGGLQGGLQGVFGGGSRRGSGGSSRRGSAEGVEGGLVGVRFGPAGPSSVAIARHQRFQLASPRSRLLETVQRVFEEVTRLVAQTFSLSAKQVISDLTLIDLTSTRQAARVQNCEAQFNATCRPTYKYRSYDGTCNNLGHPSWGMSSVCYERLVNSEYAGNGISQKRVAKSGNALPTPRRVSLEIHTHDDNPTPNVTHMSMVWGQFFDHDIALTARGQGPDDGNCCPSNPSADCDPIILEKDDPFYSKFNMTCLTNLRSAMCSTCKLGPRQQINQVTAYIDASQIYGINTNQSTLLRSNDGTGTLRFVNNPEGGELPPASENPADERCSSQDPDFDCFETGDQRANVHPGLTSLHILFLREHNRIARRLQEINPGWDEETIYQEARRIVGAEMQMITYNEFLPLVIGPERMEWFDLSVRRRVEFTEYDPTVTATLANEFSTAAFRFGHSMINSFFKKTRGRDKGNYLKDMFDNPFGMYRGDLEGIVEGMTDSPAQKFDRYMVPDVTNHLFQDRKTGSGLDLAALNINRGRDHGIPGYTTLVEFCGGPVIRRWRDLDIVFRRGLRTRFRALYESVEDIDLFSGGLSEKPLEGATVGPTFACILGIQFYHLKYGDRFYFEHGGQTGSFTRAQLRELKKTTLAKVICNNARIEQLSTNVFLYPGVRNPLQPCSNISDIDLSKWAV